MLVSPELQTQDSATFDCRQTKDSGGTRTLAKYYPANGGALGEWYDVSAITGAKFDRIGGLGGNYLAEYGTPFEMRALPSNGTYRSFEVLKPFRMQVSRTAPAFGKIGLGI